MTLQWIGASLIIAGCGGVGFGMALNYKREEIALRQLIQVLDLFCCELEYRMTPLPELFAKAAKTASGSLSKFFGSLSFQLQQQVVPDAASCMQRLLTQSRDLCTSVVFPLNDLSRTIGEYDLGGQITGIQAVQDSCRRKLEEMEANRSQRIRSYQTLGLCAGVALAILFL